MEQFVLLKKKDFSSIITEEFIGQGEPCVDHSIAQG